MNRLLFLLPVLFIACGTQPKTANRALPAAEKQAEAEPVAEKSAEVKPVARKPADAEPEPAEFKQAEAEIAMIAGESQNSGNQEEESYEEVFNEVKAFIENLNIIIQSKNYSRWRDALSEEFRKEISSQRFLTSVSQSPPLKSRGIVLKKPEDYFYIVVVPSRANSHADRIEIIDKNRVKVFFNNGDRELRLYELERRGNTWAIIQ